MESDKEKPSSSQSTPDSTIGDNDSDAGAAAAAAPAAEEQAALDQFIFLRYANHSLFEAGFKVFLIASQTCTLQPKNPAASSDPSKKSKRSIPPGGSSIRNNYSSLRPKVNTSSMDAGPSNNPVSGKSRNPLKMKEPCACSSREDCNRVPPCTKEDLPSCSNSNDADSSADQSRPSPLLVKPCAVCGDWAARKHYGVYSCETCKRFFLRTVSRELVYESCHYKDCMIGRVKRKRCNYCRYTKCLSVGMKRELVKEKHQGVQKEELDNQDHSQLQIEPITEFEFPLELEFEANLDNPEINTFEEDLWDIGLLTGKHLFEVIQWSWGIDFFRKLKFEDRVILLQNNWREFMISCICYRTVDLDNDEELYVTDGFTVDRNKAVSYGVEEIFDRILDGIVGVMRDIDIDPSEVGFVQAILLFNPTAEGLTDPESVSKIEDTYCQAMYQYCSIMYPESQARRHDLLWIRATLIEVAEESLGSLLFYKLIRQAPFDKFLAEYLQEVESS